MWEELRHAHIADVGNAASNRMREFADSKLARVEREGAPAALFSSAALCAPVMRVHDDAVHVWGSDRGTSLDHESMLDLPPDQALMSSVVRTAWHRMLGYVCQLRPRQHECAASQRLLSSSTVHLLSCR
jgi:hypothetical protein